MDNSKVDINDIKHMRVIDKNNVAKSYNSILTEEQLANETWAFIDFPEEYVATSKTDKIFLFNNRTHKRYYISNYKRIASLINGELILKAIIKGKLVSMFNSTYSLSKLYNIMFGGGTKTNDETK